MPDLVMKVFVAFYLGMALARRPGLMVDRTGIALLGAIILYAAAVMDGPGVARRSMPVPLAILGSNSIGS